MQFNITRTLIVTTLMAMGATVTQAATVTVTHVDDIDDFGGSRMIADLPGPNGLVSMREAVIAVNNTPGDHRVEFAIPVDPEDPSEIMLRIDGSAFVVTRDNTTIDFLSQAIFMGDPDPDGPGLGIRNTHPSSVGQPAIIINASESEVRGLGQTQFRQSISVQGGSANRFVRNFTNSIELSSGSGSTTGNVIGGIGADDGNEIDSVSITCGANDNIVIGNVIESIGIAGSPFCADGTNFPTGNRIGGPTPAERNVINDFSGIDGVGCPEGVGISIQWARQTTIEGNYIGLSSDGLVKQNSGRTGINLIESDDTVIQGNVIAGIRRSGVAGCADQLFGTAIFVSAFSRPTDGLIIEGNIIGLDANGEQSIATLEGIEIRPQPDPIVNVLINNNIISQTDTFGTLLEGSAVSAVEISENSISENGERGIIVSGGANGSPGIPDLQSGTSSASGTTVSGQLAEIPNNQFRIEVFANQQCDASGFGEGEVFLGSFVVESDASGDASFNETVPGVAPGEWVVTATATNLSTNSTSEFSACQVVEFDASAIFIDSFSQAAAPVNCRGVPDNHDPGQTACNSTVQLPG